MKLYNYNRSSAAYRVRIALNLKGLEYDSVPVNLLPVDLLEENAENWQPEYLAINPQGLVPALADNSRILTQSLAIIEYLEEIQPQPSLLPESAADRAWVRALAQIVTSEIHPLNNLRVLDYLKQNFSAEQEQIDRWYCHWMTEGFRPIEKMLSERKNTTKFCLGDYPTIADCCLIPQVFNARRFNCDISEFPQIEAIDRHCRSLITFQKAAPEYQSDAN